MTVSIFTTFLQASPAEFWEAIGVFPDAFLERDGDSELNGQEQRLLASLGGGNLRFLCEEASVLYTPDAEPLALAEKLRTACTDHTLSFLKELMRNRIQALEAVYESRFSSHQKSAHEAALGHLSNDRDSLKTFTKLCLIYRSFPDSLAEIYYRGLWQSRASSFQYQAKSSFPGDLVSVMRASADALGKVLKSANSNREVRFLNAQELSDGTVIVVFLRTLACNQAGLPHRLQFTPYLWSDRAGPAPFQPTH